MNQFRQLIFSIAQSKTIQTLFNVSRLVIHTPWTNSMDYPWSIRIFTHSVMNLKIHSEIKSLLVISNRCYYYFSFLSCIKNGRERRKTIISRVL